MSRILLVGGHGQVGCELATLLPGSMSLARPSIDLAQPESLRDPIRSYLPDVIVNAAAYTAVDRAESEPELAQAVNALAPRIMAEEAQRLGAAVIHLSTDYVFDGLKNTPYLESDPTNPTSTYGQSKLAGEVNVREVCARHLILRTAWVCGARGKTNFVKTMLRLGSEREQLRVVVDQVGSPTSARHVARTIVAMLPHLQRQTITPGIYNVTNSGVASWYDFALAIFEEARSLGWSLKVRDVVPITTADYPTPARRPAFSVLSWQKTSAVMQTQSPHWRQELRELLAEMASSRS